MKCYEKSSVFDFLLTRTVIVNSETGKCLHKGQKKSDFHKVWIVWRACLLHRIPFSSSPAVNLCTVMCCDEWCEKNQKFIARFDFIQSYTQRGSGPNWGKPCKAWWVKIKYFSLTRGHNMPIPCPYFHFIYVEPHANQFRLVPSVTYLFVVIYCVVWF